ncbi:hypothetical protein [Arcobacter vandammei]|uniref:hypothetical protein n=1 Tax=Arcobacter vandammei TaxID=2782243 RepID=UPI0018DFF438|nr:hypothetical protein [Arcobacter vandammei]
MRKRNYWPLFFIAIFGFTVYMIIWTIVQASKAPVIEDKSFIKKYQFVDENYNNIMNSNANFLEKYNLEFDLNGKVFPLTTEDIKFGQRVIEKYSSHKDILNVGTNNIKLFVINRATNEKMPLAIDLIVTKNMSNDGEVSLKNENFSNNENIYNTKFEITDPVNWIITGSFKIENSTGYIFIKTNAK